MYEVKEVLRLWLRGEGLGSIGIGGSCPSCDESIPLEELLGRAVTVETSERPSRHRRT